MMFLAASALKAGVIVAVALLMLPLLRRQSAALRHSVLAAAILGAGSLPIIGLAMPSWEIASWPLPAATLANPDPDAQMYAADVAPPRLDLPSIDLAPTTAQA